MKEYQATGIDSVNPGHNFEAQYKEIKVRNVLTVIASLSVHQFVFQSHVISDP